MFYKTPRTTMLEHYVKKLCTIAAAGLLGSVGCESSGDTQDSGNPPLDVQVDIPDANTNTNAEIFFRNADYGAPQNECPTESPCQPYKSSLEDDDPVLGNKCAPVSIIWFGDYQNDIDRKFWKQTLPRLMHDYISSGMIKLVFRDFPLKYIHPLAEIAAEFAHCAGEQGKYWEMHDKIFAEQAEQGDGYVNFSSNDLKQWAGEIGLDVAKVEECYYGDWYTAEIQKDYEDGKKAGVYGVPTFFINDEIFHGIPIEYSEFTDIIDAKLKEQGCE